MEAILILTLLAVTTVTPAAAAADESAARGSEWRLGIGPTVGGLLFDPDLANYRWDTQPALQTGLQATLLRGRFAAGSRLMRTHTTQASGIPGESQAPRVNLTGVEILGQVRVIGYRGIEMWGLASLGRLYLSYEPDQLTFDVGGITEPITVDYTPISEWDFGFGLELRADLMNQLAIALQAERSTFALDTAHRRGDEIVESRERFYSWSLRLQLAWLFHLG
jgi:hypothetical protein